MQRRHGATRQVFLIGRLAVKFPRTDEWERFLLGLLANLQERRFWKTLKHPKLCPIHFCDPMGLLVVMPRVETLREPLAMDEAIAFAALPEGGTLPCDSGDKGNFGWYRGRMVIVDYG